MRAIGWGQFIRDERAGVAIEFVALLQAFLFLFFFVFEMGIAVFWGGTVEKAAQIGARFAVVSDFAVNGLFGQKNGVAANFIPGDQCRLGENDPCTPFALTCAGGADEGCNALGFDAIVARMAAIAPLIQPENVSITYEYAGLGFAGGPIVPRVTVAVQNVPYEAVMTSFLVSMISMVTRDPDSVFPLTTLPSVSVTLTGEDLSTGAS